MQQKLGEKGKLRLSLGVHERLMALGSGVSARCPIRTRKEVLADDVYRKCKQIPKVTQ